MNRWVIGIGILLGALLIGLSFWVGIGELFLVGLALLAGALIYWALSPSSTNGSSDLKLKDALSNYLANPNDRMTPDSFLRDCLSANKNQKNCLDINQINSFWDRAVVSKILSSFTSLKRLIEQEENKSKSSFHSGAKESLYNIVINKIWLFIDHLKQRIKAILNIPGNSDIIASLRDRVIILSSLIKRKDYILLWVDTSLKEVVIDYGQPRDIPDYWKEFHVNQIDDCTTYFIFIIKNPPNSVNAPQIRFSDEKKYELQCAKTSAQNEIQDLLNSLVSFGSVNNDNTKYKATKKRIQTIINAYGNRQYPGKTHAFIFAKAVGASVSYIDGYETMTYSDLLDAFITNPSPNGPSCSLQQPTSTQVPSMLALER